MSSNELTVADVVSVVTCGRAVLARLAPPDKALSTHNVRETLAALAAADETVIHKLASEIAHLHGALSTFERAPAGVGRAGAGKR